MSPSRYRFTIGQMLNATFVCALLFAAIPMKGPADVVFFLPALPVFVAQPFRWFVLIGCGLSYYMCFYFYPDPAAETTGVPVFVACAFLTAASSLVAPSPWKAKRPRNGDGQPGV